MFKQLVKDARSFRRFKEDEPISLETLRELVDMARMVPCGGNQQPLRYRIVHGSDCAKVFPHLAWAASLKDWKGPAVGEQPTGYIIILSAAERKSPPGTDIGIAAQTIQLGATHFGFGACQLGSIKRELIHQELAISDQWAVNLVIAIGKPAETVVLEDLAPDAPTTYYRTLDKVHHVPKRRLDDVLI